MAVAAHKIKTGQHSTMDMPTGKVNKAPKKKPKAPEDTPEFRKEVKAEYEKALEDYDRHERLLKRSKEQRVKLEASHAKSSDVYRAEVRAKLEDNFDSKSDKGMMDVVLQMPMKDKNLLQLESNIEKLKAQEIWHREEKARLSREKARLEAQMDLFRANDCCRDIKESWQDIVDLVGAGDRFSRKLHDAVGQLRSIKGDFNHRMTRNGVPEVVTVMLQSHFDKFRSTRLLEMVHVLVSLPHRDNPFYIPARVGNRNGYGGVQR